MELERLGAAEQQMHGAHALSPSEAHDRLCGVQSEGERPVDLERVHQRHVLLPGDHRQAETGPQPLREHGGEQVGPVIAGARDEGTGSVDPVGEQRLLAEVLLVQDERSPQVLGKPERPACVLLHHLDVETFVEEPARHEVADLAAAEDHHVVDTLDVAVEVGHDLRDLLARGGDHDVVAGSKALIGCRDGHLAVADDADDRVGPDLLAIADQTTDQG